MIETWRKALDEKKVGGAILTDLSKAFDCLNHELLIAKLEAYGFDKSALRFIYDYLKNRMQRTRVNDSYSSWRKLLYGVVEENGIKIVFFKGGIIERRLCEKAGVKYFDIGRLVPKVNCHDPRMEVHLHFDYLTLNCKEEIEKIISR